MILSAEYSQDKMSSSCLPPYTAVPRHPHSLYSGYLVEPSWHHPMVSAILPHSFNLSGDTLCICYSTIQPFMANDKYFLHIGPPFPISTQLFSSCLGLSLAQLTLTCSLFLSPILIFVSLKNMTSLLVFFPVVLNVHLLKFCKVV